jgi:dsDNA-specific endonuclease/ATPase MutS2
MQDLDLDFEQRRERIVKIVKYVSLPIVAFIVAPFIFVTIKGLIGLVIAGVISVVIVNMIPWFSAVVANWRLKAIKHEAAKNPIETLQNDFNRRRLGLVAFRQAILNSKAEVATFRDKLDGFKKQFPADAAKFDQQLQQMVALLQQRGRKYQEARNGLERYDAEITRAKAIWEMAQAAAEMNKKAGLDNDQFLAKIQVETALDSVQKNLNMAFAELEMSLADGESKEVGRVGKAVPVTPIVAAPAETEGGTTSLDLDVSLEGARVSKRA